jgi:hypothetical protein
MLFVVCFLLFLRVICFCSVFVFDLILMS